MLDSSRRANYRDAKRGSARAHGLPARVVLPVLLAFALGIAGISPSQAADPTPPDQLEMTAQVLCTLHTDGRLLYHVTWTLAGASQWIADEDTPTEFPPETKGAVTHVETGMYTLDPDAIVGDASWAPYEAMGQIHLYGDCALAPASGAPVGLGIWRNVYQWCTSDQTTQRFSTLFEGEVSNLTSTRANATFNPTSVHGTEPIESRGTIVETIGLDYQGSHYDVELDHSLMRPCYVAPFDGVFIDDDESVFQADIEWMATEGITKGCNPSEGNSRFCPDSIVTRGQMAAFLVRALGLTESGVDPFDDDDDSIFQADIEKLAFAGITKGCNPSEGNTKFCPDSKVTRGQMAAFLVRAMGYTDNGGGDLFEDDDNSIFEADIDRLGTAGVTKGCNPSEGNTMFCPNSYVTRGQMAAFLHRALGG